MPIFEPTHWDDEIGRRKYGALRAEFHNMSAFRYNNLYLGLLGVLYVTAEQDPDDPHQMPCDGPIDAQWAYSRDGINWQHADRARTSAIPRGAGDAFDRGMIIGTCKEPVVVGEEVHWYYSGAENTHGGKLEYRVKRIGRVTWRRDRFVALAGTGEVATRAVQVPAGARRLQVNADARAGQLRVELCDVDGRVLAGFAREDCASITGDDLRAEVRWQGGDVPAGAVKLRFALAGARP